jgi:hypothetical protein
VNLEDMAAAGIDVTKVAGLPDGGWTYQSGPLEVTWGPAGFGGWEYTSTLTTPDGPNGGRQDSGSGWARLDAEMLRTVATAGQLHEIGRRIDAGEFRVTSSEGTHDDDDQ